MHKQIELLAPAGDYDAFTAAVESGADAVYMGGRLFNARQFAGNFDNDNLKRAIDYAHVRDVKVYLTMNTLVSDSELRQAVDFVEEAYLMGIDAVIVQDLGFAGLIRRIIPDVDLHASTQMTIYNLEGVQALEHMGFKRVVLARELSIGEIKEITDKTSVEIEVFVHGALCISYSGQCLMSSMIGGRSGNRGKCAQPCRLPYDLIQAGRKLNVKSVAAQGSARFLLSPKDICSVTELDNLVKSGVSSLKIEGRMKSPEYVSTVVKIYRKYIDEILGTSEEGIKTQVEKQDIKELAQIFNRGGFSTGYLNGKQGRDMMSYEKPKNWGIYLGEVVSYNKPAGMVGVKLEEDISIGDGIEVWNGEEESPGTVVTEIRICSKNARDAQKGNIVELGNVNGKVYKGNKVYKTSDKKLLTSAREYISGRFYRRVGITGKLSIINGSPAVFTVWDDAGNQATAVGNIMPQKAVNKALSESRLIEQLGKTGSTPFELVKLDIELDSELVLPISEINDLRRRALEELEVRKLDRYSRKMCEDTGKCKDKLLHFPGESRNKNNKLCVSLFCYQYNKDIDYAAFSADRLYLPLSAFIDEASRSFLAKYHGKGTEIYLWLPSVTRGSYDRLIKSGLNNISQWNIDGILAGNLGTLELLKTISHIKIMGDYTLNIFNSFTAEELANLNISGAALSPELTLSQIQRISTCSRLACEAVVYGRIPLMTSEYCPVGSIAGGHGKSSKCSAACGKGTYKLKDRMGMEFPVMCDKIDCRSTIFNSNVLLAIDSLDKLKGAGVDMARLIMTDETEDEMKAVVEMYREAAVKGTRIINKYSELINAIKAKGYTKGHYYRGV